MPQDSSASPRWFVKVINEVIKDLKQEVAYLDDAIVFDSDPVAHVRTIRSLFQRLRKHNLKFSPSKALLGATDANFLGHSISPGGLRPNAEKVSALTNIPMPADVKQVRAFMGGVNYYCNFLPDLSKRIRPINVLLREGVLSLHSHRVWRSWCDKSWRTHDPADPRFPRLGRRRRRLTPVSHVLRRVHRRVRRHSRTGADGRLHKTHRVHQSSYARLGKALDSS